MLRRLDFSNLAYSIFRVEILELAEFFLQNANKLTTPMFLGLALASRKQIL